MTDDADPRPPKKPRADAQRNRVRVLAAAKAAFAANRGKVSLEEVARAAGVGIGTLYRHFPTRDALVEEVYCTEMRQLVVAATRLASGRPPVEALRAWMHLFVDHLATKDGMREALQGLVDGAASLYATWTGRITTAFGGLVDAAVESGDVRVQTDPIDLLRAVAAVAHASGSEDASASAKRLVDVLVAGLRMHAIDRDRPTKRPYARIERERRFLLERLPAGVDPLAYERLEDLYIAGTHLRLRELRTPDGAWIVTKLGQKIIDPRAAADPRCRQMTTIYLPEDEATRFAVLPGLRTTKRRYRLREQGFTFCIDVWERPLAAKATIVAEVEAESIEALTRVALPSWALREVTEDTRYGAIALAEG